MMAYFVVQPSFSIFSELEGQVESLKKELRTTKEELASTQNQVSI